jgi:hypothetical protein
MSRFKNAKRFGLIPAFCAESSGVEHVDEREGDEQAGEETEFDAADAIVESRA